jgi:hypothetical protein
LLGGPDWVCEILSPTTRTHNLLVEAPYYASIGVSYLWIVDLDARALLVSKLEGACGWRRRCWREVMVGAFAFLGDEGLMDGGASSLRGAARGCAQARACWP